MTKVRHTLLWAVCLLLARIPAAMAEPAPEHGETDPMAAHGAAVDAAHADAAHGAADAAHGGGVGLPQFDPSSFASQVFWLAIMFVVLYAFFSKKALPDIGAVMKKRDSHIRGALESAKRQKEVAEGLQAEYERDIENARLEATGAFTAVEKAIKEKADAGYKTFQQNAAKQIEKTEAEIEKAKAAAMEDMHSLAAEIASQAAEKIIGVETDLDQAKTLVRSLKAKAA
jgi:F-type H+-transporting ATPase subunit b